MSEPLEFTCLQCGDKYTLDYSPSELYCSEECYDEWVDVASDEVCADDWKLNEEARAARRRLEQAGEIPVVDLVGYSNDSFEASSRPSATDFFPLEAALRELSVAVDEGFGTVVHRLVEALGEPVTTTIDFSALSAPSPITLIMNGQEYDGTVEWHEVPELTVSNADERTLVNDDPENDSA